jgi:O-antigen/teichoic acid export membrane protein
VSRNATTPTPAPERAGGVTVVRNAGWLVLAQVAAAPVAIAVNAVLARGLGPGTFGQLYLAATVGGFAVLLVEWGQSTVLPGLVARDHDRAGALLGTALAWRAAGGVAACVAAVLAAPLLGGHPDLRLALPLVAAALALQSLARAGLDAVRGFERTDVAAAGAVGQQLLLAALVVPAVLLGAGLPGVLAAQVAAAAAGLVVVLAALRPLRVPRLAVRREAAAALAGGGSAFVLLGLATSLQPGVDAAVLGRLAPAEVMGWHAAALKLVAALTFPAASLVTALYPTLFRLWAEDRDGYRRAASAGLRTAALVGAPLALGCALFPELGTWIFDRATFGRAEENLRVLGAYVALLYPSMVLGACLSAAGRQRAWALAQVGCVGVALLLDLLLVPALQARTGNGGLGVALSLVACEALMLGVAVVLVPRGLLDGALRRTLVGVGVAGAALAGTALALRAAGPWVAALASGVVYAVALISTGALRAAELPGWQLLSRLLSRAPPAP